MKHFLTLIIMGMMLVPTIAQADECGSKRELMVQQWFAYDEQQDYRHEQMTRLQRRRFETPFRDRGSIDIDIQNLWGEMTGARDAVFNNQQQFGKSCDITWLLHDIDEEAKKN